MCVVLNFPISDQGAQKTKTEEVSEGLYALSCGSDLRVKKYASCSINGIRYSTLDREKFR